MTRYLRAALFFIPALALASCASTMSVSSHVDHTANFMSYRTYSWGPADALPTGDPRLDKDPFFKDQFQGAVEKQLALKGLALITSGNPDLLVHYHANISEKLDVSGIDLPKAYCIGEGCQADVALYDAGTLVLDIVDAKTNKLIWRGWAQDAMKKMLDDQNEMAREIKQAVPRMVDQFPKEF
jgi:hypothetical protein